MSETLKIFTNNKDYLLTFTIEKDILNFEIRDNLNPEDKFKNNYTYKKLITKAPPLSYFCKNIIDIKNEFLVCIKKSMYTFQKIDFFALFTLDIEKFPNKKMNFPLELFLYKTDSRQATLMLTDLENKVQKVIDHNNDLKATHTLLTDEINNITLENQEIENKIGNMQKEVLDVIEEKKNKVTTVSSQKGEEIIKTIQKIKEILAISIRSGKRMSLGMHEIPIIRPDDKKNLVMWFNNLEFDLVKLYDSMIQGDTLSKMKELTKDKKQTLIVIELESGKRFGAYISLPFFHSESSDDSYMSDDPNAFIFSFDKKKHFRVTNQKYIVNFTDDGILYGSGPDLFISEGFASSNKNYSNITSSYGEGEKLDEGYTRMTYLAGIEYFKIRKLEIHQVIFK